MVFIYSFYHRSGVPFVYAIRQRFVPPFFCDRICAALIERMKKDERHPVELSQKQTEQKLDAEKRMADARVALAHARQEAAAK